jgi:hypothetical protein
MDMNKKEAEPAQESKWASKGVILAVFLAFACGAYVKGEVSKREDTVASGTCRITINGSVSEDGKLSTDIQASGSQDSCASILGAIQAQNDADAQQDDQAASETDAPCDSASDAAAASAAK